MTDNPAIKAGPSVDDTDYPTLESGPSALCQNTSNDVPTPMEEDDLLGEDLVDYGATPEHSGIDVNAIMFSAVVLLSMTINLSLLNSISEKNRSTI
jgi:hypothetical protein